MDIADATLTLLVQICKNHSLYFLNYSSEIHSIISILITVHSQRVNDNSINGCNLIVFSRQRPMHRENDRLDWLT